MSGVTTAQAHAALDAVGRAQSGVGREIGLPRTYWWAMAAGWVVLGVIGDVGPAWLAITATVLFGAGHATVASRLLDGRRRTSRVQVSRAVAGHRLPMVVVGMLLVLVAVTIGTALMLDADGAGHAAIWASVLVASVVGFGGPEILDVLRRRIGA